MKLPKWTLVLLSIALALTGVLTLLGVGLSITTPLASALAILAGLKIFFDIITGPSIIGPTDPDPKKYIGTECLPPGSTKPTGARIRIVDTSGTTIYHWDFSCEELAQFGKEIDRIYTNFCQNGNNATPSGTVVKITIDPYQSTTTGTKGIRVKGPNGNFLFPCKDIPELLTAIGQAFSGCCL